MKWDRSIMGNVVHRLELGNGLITAKVVLTPYGLFETELNGQYTGDFSSLASAKEYVERCIREGLDQMRKEIEAG